MKLKTVKTVLRHKMCLGCGLCKVYGGSEMICNDRGFVPKGGTDCSILNQICPSIGYNINSLGEQLFPQTTSCYELGHYQGLYSTSSLDKTILKNASSGGIITAIAKYLLINKYVDAVVCNKFIYEGSRVRTLPFIANSVEDLYEGQGSKYCPTDTLVVLEEIKKKSEKKYCLIATPCQVAGFRLASLYDEILKERVPYVISNFCGGYRDFREIDFFVKKKAGFSNVSFFRHRGGGQPGSLLIRNNDGKEFTYPYPDYAHLSPIVKNERCTLCVDATGELADFSCGDAWLKNRKNYTEPLSIVVPRSAKAMAILRDMLEAKEIVLDEITEQEVKESQKYNIDSKKYRQFQRIKARNTLMLYSPDWHECVEDKEGSLLREYRIILSKIKQNIKYGIQRDK